jgi:hypothetical protein
MSSVWQALNDAIRALADVPAWSAVGAITAAGTISMAALQLVKEMTPIRRKFQRHWLVRWIAERTEDSIPKGRRSGRQDRAYLKTDAEGVEQKLVDLATGGDWNAFYDLTSEQLVAQMNAAAQAALDYPHLNANLLSVLAHGADANEIGLLVSAPRRSTTRGTRSGGNAVPPASSPEFLAARTASPAASSAISMPCKFRWAIAGSFGCRPHRSASPPF